MSAAKLDPRSTTYEAPAQIDAALIDRARTLATASLHEAGGRIGALPSAIKPVAKSFRLSGTAVPVHGPGGDNLWLHRALYSAKRGDVLVAFVDGQYEHGYWGEVMSTAAKARGLAGLVIDGCVRDVKLLELIGFPVFARGVCIRGTSKDFNARGFINAPTLFGDVTVHPGDLTVGDEDGVVCIPRSRAGEVIEAAQRREAREASECKQLETDSVSTLSLYGWE